MHAAEEIVEKLSISGEQQIAKEVLIYDPSGGLLRAAQHSHGLFDWPRHGYRDCVPMRGRSVGSRLERHKVFSELRERCGYPSILDGVTKHHAVAEVTAD